MFLNRPIKANDYNRRWYEPERRYIYEHREIMEKHLGRKLEQHEQIHHKNGDPKDNRISNLQVLTRSEHAKLHREWDKKN